MPRWINVANLLTLLRLVLVPFVIHAILDGRHTLALALFATAAFTDILDGAAARRFGLASATGAYLDPIADKCLLSGVYLALALARMVPWWVAAIVLGRDVYILLGAALVRTFTGMGKFPPSIWGKACTLVQVVTGVTWMVRNMLGLPVLDALASAMLWPCAAVTIGSGMHYTRRVMDGLRHIDGVPSGE